MNTKIAQAKQYIEEHRTQVAFCAGVWIGAGVITAVDYKYGNNAKSLMREVARVQQMCDQWEQIANDTIDFIEDRGLRREAVDYIATLPVTL